MIINIVSSDKRYFYLNKMLNDSGYCSKIVSSEENVKCDFLILSVKNDLSEEELKRVLSGIDEKTVILCGNDKRVNEFFSGTIINYAKGEEFLLANANLTAEATISYIHNTTVSSVEGKRIFVSGYGRISKKLCQKLKGLGALVFVYARRKEAQEQIVVDGYTYVPISFCKSCDIIINTVPSVIFTNDIISTISKDAEIIELASAPYGFENTDRVKFASGLPGKILPLSAAKIIFDTIVPYLSGKD